MVARHVPDHAGGMKSFKTLAPALSRGIRRGGRGGCVAKSLQNLLKCSQNLLLRLLLCDIAGGGTTV